MKNFNEPEMNEIGTTNFEHVFAGKSGVNGNNGHFGTGNVNSNNQGHGHGSWEGDKGHGKGHGKK